MSNPRQLTPLPVSDTRAETILFSSSALYKLEEKTNMTTQQVGRYLLLGQGGIHLIIDLVWAGLEGSRVKLNNHPGVWTTDAVCELMDDAGGPEAVLGKDGKWTRAVIKAFTGAYPEDKKDDDKKEGAGQKASDPPPPVPSPGTTTSQPGSDADGPKTSSGT